MGRRKKEKTIQVEEKSLIEGKDMTQGTTPEVQLETLEKEIDVARLELERTRMEIEEKKKDHNAPQSLRDMLIGLK